MKIRIVSYMAGGYGINLEPENDDEESILEAAAKVKAVLVESGMGNEKIDY